MTALPGRVAPCRLRANHELNVRFEDGEGQEYATVTEGGRDGPKQHTVGMSRREPSDERPRGEKPRGLAEEEVLYDPLTGARHAGVVPVRRAPHDRRLPRAAIARSGAA